jgi:hypothetical protein
MEIESARAKEIEAYIANHPKAELGKWPVEIGGQKEILPFYRFPIGLLRYNVRNGRLAMEVQEWEQNNGRTLDRDDKADAAIICEMLLGLDKEKTQILKEDLHQKGQMEPGAITYDGVVINGNRRMALLEEMHHEEPTGRWEYIEAVRLPVIGEKDLWKIEAGLQLSKDKIAEYHPVNELLKIKQGIDAKLTPKEVAAAMYGRTEDEIQDALARLSLIDNFLEFHGQPGNYGFIKKFGLHEYFIDIQKYVLGPAKREGERKKEIQKRLMYAFALVRASTLWSKKGEDSQKKITHWEIRKLSKIFPDAHARGAYLEHLENTKDMAKVAPETVVEDFYNALDVISMKEQRGQPVKLIEKAIKALESIDRKSSHFYEGRVLHAVKRLSRLVKEMEQSLAKKLDTKD